jgi:glyceraldehyde 3-phosphate dehydrogenase
MKQQKHLLINGSAGRIGRGVTYQVASLLDANSSITLRALNEPAGLDAVIESYTSRDPVHGFYNWHAEKATLGADPAIRIIKEDKNLDVILPFFAEKDPSKIPFNGLGINMVLECSGFYGDPKKMPAENLGRVFLNQEIVERVIETYPAKTADVSLIMGVNHLSYNPEKHYVISNASCTTKALALPLQILLDNNVQIDALSMDTTHAATASQKVLESLGQIVTHSTGAAKATGLVIPSLKGKMAGMSYRVPTLDGSFANLYFVASSDEEVTAQNLNDMMRKAVVNPKYANRLGVFEGEDAGTFDIIGRKENAIVIASKTNVIPLSFSKDGKKSYLVTLISGYDNELGSAVDPVLLTNYIGSK